MQPLRQLVFGQIHVEHGTDVVPSLIFIRSEDSSGQVRKVVLVSVLSRLGLFASFGFFCRACVGTCVPVEPNPARLSLGRHREHHSHSNSCQRGPCGAASFEGTAIFVLPELHDCTDPATNVPAIPDCISRGSGSIHHRSSDAKGVCFFRALLPSSLPLCLVSQLEGVLVTATVDGDVPVDLTGVLPGEITATSLTSAGGTFTLQPLHPDVRYNFAAEKDGFHFKRVLDSAIAELEFIHQRLGSASVTVMDKAGAALPGVVLSFSGDAYRHNGLSNATGVFVAPNLFPGRYFLRPMLKEYSFLPSSLDVEILEGHNTEVLISATRVAYSVFGCVTSVNGNPVGNVTITAVGTGIAAEKAITDSATVRLLPAIPVCDFPPVRADCVSFHTGHIPSPWPCVWDRVRAPSAEPKLACPGCVSLVSSACHASASVS